MSHAAEANPCFLDDVAVQDAFTNTALSIVSSLGLVAERSAGPSDDLTFDAWVPSKNVGFDLHDLMGGRPGIYDRGFLRNKLVRSRAANVRYVQFFSDEWRAKEAVCRSVVTNALGSTPMKLHARDCEMNVVTALETKPFLDSSHVQGATRSSGHMLLVHPLHGIVGAVTIRTPIQKKWGHVCELARVAFKPGFSVRGGSSKMVSFVKDYAKQRAFDGILSYAELRFGTGRVYDQCGFTNVGETTVNYWYTDGAVRFDRFKYRAQPGKTEKQVVDEAGVRPVWGAGHKIFLLKL